MSGLADEWRSSIASTTGGVLCRDVGAITGELEVSTRLSENGIEASVRYAGADEWYTVDGSPISFDAAETREPEELHYLVTECLKTPGKVSNGNEEPVSLKDLRTA